MIRATTIGPGHGYACIRLDIRGTGESEGLITDEYASAGTGRCGRGHCVVCGAGLV